MGLVEKLGIKIPKIVFLGIQIALTFLLLVVSIYLLMFVIVNNLGGWMIASYVQITISTLAFLLYFAIGYRKGEVAYYLAILPFAGAVFVNVLLPQRSTFQIATLCLLFASVIAFLLRQKDRRFTFIICLVMVSTAATFSIYSAINADLSFLGNITNKWFSYFSMYLSIFVPLVMSVTLALIYNIKVTRTSQPNY